MITILDLKFKGVPHSVASFLLRLTDGFALVETGPYSTYPTLVSQLESHNVKPEDVKYVFLTHIHLDHAGAAWALARSGSKIYVHPEGVRHLLNPEKLWTSAKMIYGNDMEMLWGEMQPIPQDQVVAVENREEIKLNDLTLIAHHTPGHAKHHIAWQWGENLFCGDVAGVKIAGGPIQPPCPPPDINLDNWIDSITLMKSLEPERIYLTHFGGVDNAKEHLTKLKENLIQYAEWIKPYFTKKTSVEEIIPLFQAFINNQLSENGLQPEDQQAYDAANPSWMSVSGLLRYWSKKTGEGLA